MYIYSIYSENPRHMEERKWNSPQTQSLGEFHYDLYLNQEEKKLNTTNKKLQSSCTVPVFVDGRDGYKAWMTKWNFGFWQVINL